MPQPLTRAQQLENAAFLRHLRKSGNVREAATALGFTRERFIKRRNKHSAFAVRWDAAIVQAHATLKAALKNGAGASPATRDRHILRGNFGRLQLRTIPPSRIGHAARQRFLAALSATANVVLSAAAIGFTPTALYRHRRRNPAFAREWGLALKMGYDRLEHALLESMKPTAFADDDWRRNDPPAIPPMTANQALQLLYLHQKEARLWDTPIPWDRLRPGETMEARSEMLGMIAAAKRAQDRERFKLAEAERLARGEPTYVDWEAEDVTLPDLSQVTGWSRADPAKVTKDASRALFGGWRVEAMKAGKKRGDGSAPDSAPT
ncbi:MAG: hypothetical protein V4659_11110 [Pseudomonadota bacterium]